MVAYQKLLSKHPAVQAAFEGCRVPETWPPPKVVASNAAPMRKKSKRQPDDYPQKTHEARISAKREPLSEAQNHRCAYCGERFGEKSRLATLDHFIPRCEGGVGVWHNEIMACLMCNNGRGDFDAMEYFVAVQMFGRVEAAKIFDYKRSERDRGPTRKPPFSLRFIDRVAPKNEALAAALEMAGITCR